MLMASETGWTLHYCLHATLGASTCAWHLSSNQRPNSLRSLVADPNSICEPRKNRLFRDGLFMAHMPLTKWNQIKAEMIEMWQIVRTTHSLVTVTV